MSLLHRFRDTMSYFPTFKEVTWLATHPVREQCVIVVHSQILLIINPYMKFEMPSLFTHAKDMIGAQKY